MKSIALFFETKQGKYIKNLVIGLGAAVVLIGALFKLQHWPGAGTMLTVGLFTEAFLFCLLGILPPHKDYYWERYYPNLDENPHVEAYRKGVKFAVPNTPLGAGGSGSNATASLDKMLEEANINAPNLKRLNENFQKFGHTVEQIKDITDVTAATGTYSQSAREAADALGKLKETYTGAVATMQSFNSASESTAQFHQQVTVLSKNLGTLNQIYEVELQDANNHLKAMNKFYSKNLGALNNIYGNMLSAMQGR
jgi:gliding motility-associated protein GldL